MARRLRVVGLGLFGVVAAVTALCLHLRHPLPPGGESGPAADDLAHSLERAVSLDGWNATGALRWRIGHRRHLWDCRRSYARVEWGKHVALVDLTHVTGLAFEDGRRLEGEEAHAVIGKAYRWWINDSFWLNPLVKLFDGGVTRSRLEVDGKPALLVTYGSGGVTPGDRYLWLVGDDGLPRAWRLYVSILPISGVELSWQDWVTLPTGARVATAHRALGLNGVAIKDLAGAASLAELEGADPFAALATTSQ